MINALKGIFIGILFILLAINLMASQAVDPLFYKLTSNPDSNAALALLTKLTSTTEFATQLAFFTDMFGKDFQREVFRTKTERAQHITTYHKLLQKNSKNRDLLLALSVLYFEDEDNRNAAIYYKRAKAIDPWLKVDKLEKVANR